MFTALSSGYNFLEGLIGLVVGNTYVTYEDSGIFQLFKGLKTLIGLVK